MVLITDPPSFYPNHGNISIYLENLLVIIVIIIFRQKIESLMADMCLAIINSGVYCGTRENY
jgi:hypothetical protein